MDLIFGSGSKPPSGNEAGKDLIKDTTTATFIADVIEASKSVPVLVDFWATWCGPCKQLGPILEKVVRESKGAVRMVKVDVDRNQDLAMQLRVQSVPMVYAFKDGRAIDAFVGAQSESQIKAFVARLTAGQMPEGPSTAELIAEALALLAEGDTETAAQAFQQVLAEEPENAAAVAGLLRCLITAGDVEGAKRSLAHLPETLARQPEIAAVRSALELAEQANAAGPTADLRRRLSDNPDDLQVRFDLAMAYYATGEHEAAVDELLEIFRRNRAWNDDAARKQLVKFFEAFGPKHPLTVSGRRRLSSLMFA